jgi:putative ABC transport system permease protein
VGLAYAGTRLLVALSPANLPRLGAVDIDVTVLGFATLAAVVAALLFGLVPALRAARPQLADVLRTSGRNAGLARGRLLRNGVVVAEVALSFVLLVGGGLMVRSFVALARVHPGYDPSGVLTFQVSARAGRSQPEVEAFQQRLRERLESLPGVEAATAVFPLPLDGQLFNSRWGKEDAVTDAAQFKQANVHIVLPGYFAAMRTRLIEGRTFTAADNRAGYLGVIIDDLLAAKAFPGESAVGQRLFIRTARSAEAEWLDVIGVVEHQRHEGLATPGLEAIFVTEGSFFHGFAGTWVVRLRCAEGATCDPSQLSSGARSAVAELDPLLAVSAMQPYRQLVDRAMTPTRFALVMIAIFAGVAALLASVGLYAVLATAIDPAWKSPFTARIAVRPRDRTGGYGFFFTSSTPAAPAWIEPHGVHCPLPPTDSNTSTANAPPGSARASNAPVSSVRASAQASPSRTKRSHTCPTGAPPASRRRPAAVAPRRTARTSPSPGPPPVGK